MLPNIQSIQHARKARQTGLFAVLPPQHFSALRVKGLDAPSFLHSQLTNEVNDVRSGAGNRNARVTRTGHLIGIFSLHRLDAPDDVPAYVLFGETEPLAAVQQDLDSFLFADRVNLEAMEDWDWILVQGPDLPGLEEAFFGSDGPFPGDGEERITEISWQGASALALELSMLGDQGWVLGLPRTQATELSQSLRAAALERDWACLEGPELEGAFEVLRIEAGMVRVGPDTPPQKKDDDEKKSSKSGRMLPETGLEQQLVSYTKGCYLGQEVIARIRTYGALPFALRGLVFHPQESERPLDSALELLATLPEEGEDLFTPDGSKVGQIVSRSYSPILEAPVAFAYLNKASRTPTQELSLQTKTGFAKAIVELLPFYQAANREARVANLYDRAIKIFAEGKEAEALSILEECLRLDPSFSDGYEAIGVILGRSGHFHEAIDLFQRLAEVNPEEAMVHTNLSLYFMKIGDKDTAEKHSGIATQKRMEQAFRGDGNAPKKDAAQIEEEQKQARRQDAARKKDIFRQVLEIDEADPVALFGLGNAHATLEEWEEAEAVFATACETQKNNAAVFLARGKALEALGQTERAIEVYRQGMDVASRKGDLMPLKDMQSRVSLLTALKD